MTAFMTPSGAAEIIYEDGEVLCFVKPAGVLSQSALGGEASVLDFASEYTGGMVYPVHRLDRNTAGVMLAAKTKSAAAMLSGLVAEGGAVKEYLAAVNGVPENPQGTLEDDLFFDRRRDKSFVVKKGSGRRGVKRAVLDYETLSRCDSVCGREASLVKISLGTGRTHQIRVQMASMGHPLMGDGKYGGGNSRYNCSLYSFRLTLSGEGLSKTPQGRRLLERVGTSGDVSFTSRPTGGIWECFDFKL